MLLSYMSTVIIHIISIIGVVLAIGSGGGPDDEFAKKTPHPVSRAGRMSRRNHGGYGRLRAYSASLGLGAAAGFT
jgi:hypothetical protein